jgi:protein involved in polysaccharide export with SLBB domain
MIASRFLRFACLALVLSLAAGCAETPAAVQAPNPVGSPDYHLGPGDKVKITVFNNPDVSGEAVLDSSGDIALPLLGQVPALNLTVTELQSKITDLLNRQYLVDPKISVEVLNYRPFFILGEVGRPGSYPYIAGVTVRQAVAIGGGYTRRARSSSVSIVRQTPMGEERIEGSSDTLVLPGDTVEVGRRLF